MKWYKPVIAVLIGFTSCSEPPVPKPNGFFRIDLPELGFLEVPTPCGIRFETPVYSKIALKQEREDACFLDVVYPEFKAKVHLTHKPVQDNLRILVNDAQTFKSTHEAKANRIKAHRILRDSSRVFGNMYAVDGDVASPMVFYLTDSTDNFLYGALYFSVPPNGDSLAPVTERLREDILQLGATLQWP